MEDHRYAEDKVIPSKKFSIGRYEIEPKKNGYILPNLKISQQKFLFKNILNIKKL